LLCKLILEIGRKLILHLLKAFRSERIKIT